MSVSLVVAALGWWHCAAGKPAPPADAQPPPAKAEELLTDAARRELFGDTQVTCLKNSCDLNCLIEVAPRQPRESFKIVCDGPEQEKRRTAAKRDADSGLLMAGGPSATGLNATFFDDDTPCVLQVHLRGDKARTRATALAKRFARLRTPEAPGPVCAQAIVLHEGSQGLPLAPWEKKKAPSEALYKMAAGFPKVLKGSELQGATPDKVLLVGGFCGEKDGDAIAKRLSLVFPAAKALRIKGVAPTSCPVAPASVALPESVASNGLRLAAAIVTNDDQNHKAPFGRWVVTLLDGQGGLLDWKSIEIPREEPNADEKQPYDHEGCGAEVEPAGSTLLLKRSCRVNVQPWSCIERPDEVLTVKVAIADKKIKASSARAIEKPEKCTPR
jgi:hypothetical protein